MIHAWPFVFAALTVVVGCTPSGTAPTPPGLATPSVAQAVPRRVIHNAPTDSGPAEAERTLRGEIHTTKGAQLMLNGVIIPDNVLPPSDSDKRRARDKWLRKRVELRGLVKRYICRPMEQCLIGGSIPFLKRLDSLRELGPNE